MREVLWWLVALILIGLGWAGLYEMAAFATHIPVDEPPGAFGVGPMYLLGLAFPLALLSGAWLLAAVLRVLVLLVGSFLRQHARRGDG
jgi:hypothetical protein